MAAVTPVKYDSTAKKHSPFGDGDVVPASDIQISPDSNNLLRDDGTGLVVKLEAAPDIANQYVSSSSGDDTNGDGTQAKPFKTIRHAMDRIPNYTSATIWLKSGDTFHPEDGVTGYVQGGTNGQHTAANLWVGQKAITIKPYGNTTYDKVASTPGVDASLYEIGTQPTIVFTSSINSDVANTYAAPGFAVYAGGSLELDQITLQMTDVGTPAGTSSLGTSPFGPWGGNINFSGCNFKLGNLIMISGPAQNTATASVTVHSCRFDGSAGKGFCYGQLGISLKGDFYDLDGTGTLPGDTNITTRVTNFLSEVCAHGNSYFKDLTVLSAEARTYQGMTASNAITAAA